MRGSRPGREAKSKKEGASECIYCRRTKPLGEFNREHVLPDAFGTFAGALTVIHGVCTDCNQHFSQTLDFAIGRESMEGFLRYQTGVRPTAEVKNFKVGNGLQFLLDETGPEQGLLMKPIQGSDGTLGVDHVDQVRIENLSTGSVAWYTRADLEHSDWAKRAEMGPDRRVTVYASEPSVRDRIVSALSSHGVRIKKWEHEEQPARPEQVRVRMRVTVQGEIMRAAAKICFNYLARVWGNSVALESNFDVLRQYIRYDKRPPESLVFPSSKPIIAGETSSPADGRLMVHVVGLGFSRPEDLLVGQLSLFNLFQYRVVLARNYSGDTKRPASGHIYDIGNRRVILPSTLSLEAE